MDYEKKYKEALSFIKDIYPKLTGAFKEDIEHYFTEVKESEDDKMLRVLREGFTILDKYGEWYNGITNGQILAWLEKQGEPNLIENYPIFRVGDYIRNKNTNDKVLIEQIDIATKTYWYVSYDGAATNHSDFPFSQQNEWEIIGQNIIEKKPVISDDALREGIAHFGITQYQITNWLKKYVDVEKQGAQKETLCDKCKKAQPSHSCQDITTLGRCALEKQGEQAPTDNAKPKFKVGDWIVRNDGKDCFSDGSYVLQITDIDCNKYKLSNGCYLKEPFIDTYRLWTIQDVKDGDVLVTKNGNPFIHDKGRYNNGLAYYYAGLNVNGELTIKSPHRMLAHFGSLCDVIPATKEQRNTLFQKMKEAGYEWDAEKKELKKIEQATMLETCEIENIEHGKYYYCIKDYFYGGKKQASKGDVVQALRGMGIMALGVKANEYFLPVNSIKQNPTWSEEDENILEAIIYTVKHSSYSHCIGVSIEVMINWLKPLKDRVQPRWEPSNEQMRALHDLNLTGNISYAGQGQVLIDLYNDLKKLKG